MSVLHDVLDKMMADFFSKEKVWNHIRDHGGLPPPPFELTLDTPDFRQLKKGLQESRFTVGRDGILKYTPLRNADDSLFQAEEMPDEVLRTYSSLRVCYPYPANEHIYAASITHNYTGAPAQAVVPVDLPGWMTNPQVRSFSRRLEAFRTENAQLDRLSTPGEQRPGYRPGACNCIECRFEVLEQRRNRRLAGAAMMREAPRDPFGLGPAIPAPAGIIRAESSDGLSQQDRDRLDAHESVFRGISQWVVSPVPRSPTWWDEPGPVPETPQHEPHAPVHPNDPRPRMPRLSDGRPNNVENAAAIMRDIWNPNRVRF